MKKSRIFLTRTILGILAGLFLSTGILASPVQAAGISYQKAVRMYNEECVSILTMICEVVPDGNTTTVERNFP